MRRLATASPARSQMTIGGMGLGLACLCLLAFTAIAGTGTAAAAECPNEAIRIAQGATRLPDCRAYERISSVQRNPGLAGVGVLNKLLFGALRADGNAATFGTSSGVGDTERGAIRDANLAHRSADGWTSFGTLTTSEPSVPSDFSLSSLHPLPSSDMTRLMWSSERSLGLPNPLTGGFSVYLSAPEGKGPPIWLSHWSSAGTQPTPPAQAVKPLGGTPNFSSGYFAYPTPLTSLAGDNLRTSNSGLYSFAGPAISPAGVLPSGSVSPLGALAAGSGATNSTGSNVGGLASLARNEVSSNGSKLFFASPAEGSEPKQLYVEEGGAPGRLISHDPVGLPAAAGVSSLEGTQSVEAKNSFAYATPDGSRVVFRSESALTADAPESGLKTYRAQITPSAITLTYLPAVSGAVLTINKDASTILFSTPGSVSGTSYYVWDEDRPAAPYAVAVNLPTAGGPQMLEPVFSEDGDVLVFSSGVEIEPGTVPLPESNYTQVYRWTNQSGTATCISCLRDGGTPARFGSRTGNFNIEPTDNPAWPEGGTGYEDTQDSLVGNRKISSDGSRIFFDTSDPLDPVHDVNGVRDIYMWENGKNYLLTSGRNPVPSLIVDNSESGNDVMLVTKDGLIPSDTNGTYDVYDVRVDGGFAETVEKGCEGSACQSIRAVPAASPPASRSIKGPGNRQEARLGAVKATQLGKPGKSARVRVNVPAAGRLKLGGRFLKSQSRQVKAKGAVTTRVTLTRAGKRKLAAKGSLATKVTATFRDGEGRLKKSSVTLRFKQGAHR